MYPFLYPSRERYFYITIILVKSCDWDAGPWTLDLLGLRLLGSYILDRKFSIYNLARTTTNTNILIHNSWSTKDRPYLLKVILGRKTYWIYNEL